MLLRTHEMIMTVMEKKIKKHSCYITKRMFGRDKESKIIHRLLQQLTGGKSNTLIIEGEAGIGKSMLAMDL